MADKDPRLIYEGIYPSRVNFFGYDDKGSYQRYEQKCKIAFILGASYIVVDIGAPWPEFVRVSGLFMKGKKQVYHTQKILKSVCKNSLKFVKRYPKTSNIK